MALLVKNSPAKQDESSCSAGELGSIPGLGRSPGEGKGYQLQYFGLEISMDYKSDTTEQPSHPYYIKMQVYTQTIGVGKVILLIIVYF